MSEAPPFWWERPDWRAWMLWPASAIYGAVAARRIVHGKREPLPVPVLCVGNLTVGGTGKTPVAIALAKEAARMGLNPGFLSRGHGGSGGPPHIVDAHHDSARHVGDEPLLLAGAAPVAVTADRAAGARMLIERGIDFLIMDDGFQSARLAMDFALIVVDAKRGVGNGYVIPGGPMRAPLVSQMRHVDGLLTVGKGEAAASILRQAARSGRPHFSASIVPVRQKQVAGKRVLAFAGIGDPGRFFASLEAAGATVVETRRFADHHMYDAHDLADLSHDAGRLGLKLVTTAKDAVRIETVHGANAIAGGYDVFDIEIRFDEPSGPRRIVQATLDGFDRRRHGVSARR